jgi:hypothetical protein
MQRSRPLTFVRLEFLSLCLTWVTLGLSAWRPVEASPATPGLTLGPAAASAAPLEGLDQGLRTLVDRPLPARLEDDPRDVSFDEPAATLAGPSNRATATHQAVEVFGDVFPELTAPAESTAGNRQIAESSQGGRAIATESATASLDTPLASIPPHVAALQQPLEQCLAQQAQFRLNSGKDSCWSMMHSFLGWGPTCEIHIGGPRGPRTNAIAWVGRNEPCGGRRLFYLDGDRIRGREGPGYQGHPAQFLAMLAQLNIDPAFVLGVNNRSFTVADLVDEEKRTCAPGMEMTFKLIGLVHYLGTEATWTSDNGQSWDIPKLVSIELSQPINGAACGGTHRIMSLSYAVAKRRQEGGTLDGQWWRADKYVKDYHQYAMTLQNRDGSFSSDWFRQRADWGDVDRRVQTTGHILEWLAFSLPDEALYDPRVVRSVAFLIDAFTRNPTHAWEVGPKGHAVRALRLYHERVFQSAPEPAGPLAQREDPSVQER